MNLEDKRKLFLTFMFFKKHIEPIQVFGKLFDIEIVTELNHVELRKCP